MIENLDYSDDSEWWKVDDLCGDPECESHGWEAPRLSESETPDD